MMLLVSWQLLFKLDTSLCHVSNGIFKLLDNGQLAKIQGRNAGGLASHQGDTSGGVGSNPVNSGIVIAGKSIIQTGRI